MDKNTLSNYGWVVIAVLVLAVMIALATPFGTYIRAGVENTTAGLFETSEKAMNVVGMSATSDDINPSNTITVDVIIGDVSANGIINLADLSTAQRFINGTYTDIESDYIYSNGEPADFFINNNIDVSSLSVEQMKDMLKQVASITGDCNKDGVVDDQDLTFIKNYKLGRDDIAYIGEIVTITITY